MMTFPANTPAVVREALTRYLRTRRCIAGLTCLTAGLAAAVCVLLAVLLLDRFAECAPAWRVAALWLGAGAATAGAVAGLCALLRHARVFPAAVILDQALPRNEDRWATVLDLLARQAAGEQPADADNMHRLLAETEAVTSATPVGRLVSRRGYLVAATALGLAAAALGFLHISPAFDMPLLWNRLLQPHGNWPRDSFTAIRILDVNGRQLPPDAVLLPSIPEEAAFAMKVTVSARPPRWWPWTGAAVTSERAPAAIPRLEQQRGDGCVETQEFVATGNAWLLARPQLTEELTFRIRAGDGLTAAFTQPVMERLRVQTVEHAIRFPVYSRLPAVSRRALDAEARLTVLEGANVDFFLTCSAETREFSATFDILQRKQAPGEQAAPPATVDADTGAAVRRDGKKPETQTAQRRALKVTRTGADRAKFNLLADESGILRLGAVGTNGLPARGRTIVVEAVPDAPPRLTISGLDADNWVVPGELLGLEYSAEDDLGVSDLVLEWTVAGGASFEHLTGEEYIQNEALGQKLVSGKQTIQRMNYYVYGQSPFEFRFVATDTKGQEARSEKFRIHLIRDTFATRFDVGIALFKELADILQARNNGLQSALNQLNIMAVALKGANRWPDGQEKLLLDLEEALGSRQYNPHQFNVLRAKHEYGDLPCRIEDSLSLLLAAERQLPGIPANIAAARQLRTAPAPAAAAEVFNVVLAGQKEFVAALRAAALAELARFRIEQCCQVAQRLANRLELLAAVPGDKAVFAANLENYATQTATLVQDCDEFLSRLPELAPALEHARAAATPPLDTARLLTAQRELAGVLASAPAPASPELAALPAAMSAAAGRDAQGAERFQAALALLVRYAAGAQLQQPLRIQQLNRWLTGPLPQPWSPGARSAADVWFAACELRSLLTGHMADVEADRFAMDPARRQDAEAELREYALALRNLAVDAKLAAPPGLAMAVTGAPDRVQSLVNAVDALIAAVQEEARLVWLREAWPPILAQDLDLLARRLEAMAARYDALAPAVAAAIPRAAPPPAVANAPPNPASVIDPQRSEAVRLQLHAEALEASFRNLLRLRLLTRLRVLRSLSGPQGPPEWTPVTWPELRRYHGLQLGMTLLALSSREHVAFRLFADDKDSGKWKAALEGIQGMAKLSRTLAATIRQPDPATPGPLDVAAVMQETKTMGYLDTLESEYTQLEPALLGAPSAEQEPLRTKTRGSPLGRIVVAEQALAPALALQAALKSPQAAAPKVLAERLQALQAALAAHPGQAVPEILAPFQKRVAAAAGETVRPADLLPAAQEFAKAFERELEAWRTAAQLPARRRNARQNQRDREMNDLGIWVIADTIQNHDVRWQARVQAAEICLARAVLAPTPQPAAVAAAYVRLIEMRARQLSGERRRNQGFSLLETDSGPGLKLPKHIAAEFLRARNRRPPEQFKAWSEAYYDALYRAARP